MCILIVVVSFLLKIFVIYNITMNYNRVKGSIQLTYGYIFYLTLRYSVSLSKFIHNGSKIYFPPIMNIDYCRLCIGKQKFLNEDRNVSECFDSLFL